MNSATKFANVAVAFISLGAISLAGCAAPESDSDGAGDDDAELGTSASELTTGPRMGASVVHVFDFAKQQNLKFEWAPNSLGGAWGKSVSGMNTDRTCTPGLFDERGKYYTVYLGTFVNSQNKSLVPFDVVPTLDINLTASGVHAGKLFVSAVRKSYRYGSAVVDVQFCARNVGVNNSELKQSFVRQFSLVLRPST